MAQENLINENNPQWYKDAVIYEVHIKTFSDSNGDGIGDLKGIISRLDYLQNLGITALWLLPFYPSPLKDDGYDISDYLDVHPSYGTLKDFRDLLHQAHSRGIRIITELVINHTSDMHPWFKRARSSPAGSKWRNFYVWSDTADKFSDARIIFKDFEKSNWTWDSEAGAYYWHRFYSHQPDLNFDNPLVQKAIFEAVDFWLNLGVDGLRLDAVPYLFERDGTNCENLPETHAYLKKLRKHIDSKFKNRMLLAEANQWSEETIKYFGDGDECHMAFNFPVMPRMFMAIQLEDRFPLVDIMDRVDELPEGTQWAIFLRNHDELTLEMVTDEERDSMYRFYAADPKAKINQGIRRRLAPLLWNNPKKIEIMRIMLFSLPGTPIIYYGDEICMGDNFYLGDRDGVRTPMQWNSSRNAGFSNANPQQLYLPVIIDPEYHYENVNVENQEKNLSSSLWWMRRVIAMRKQYMAFGRGTMKILSPQNPKVFAFIREFGNERILVVMNLSRFSQAAELDLTGYEGMTPVEVFSYNRFPQITPAPYIFTMAPFNYFWLLLEKERETVNLDDEKQLPVLTLMENEEGFESIKKKFEERVLPLYLKRCRWFRNKSGIIRKIIITDSGDTGKNAGINSILVIDVTYIDGPSEKYFLPVFYEKDDAALKIREAYPMAVIAAVKRGEEEGILFDAAYSQDFHSYIFSSLEKNKKIKLQGGYFSAVRMPAFFELLKNKQLPLSSSLPGVEQSNSSVIFGDVFIMKFFRKAEQGENPDIEISRALSMVFKNAPPLAGYIDYHDIKKERYSFAKLDKLIQNEGDAWRFVCDHAVKYFEKVLSSKEKSDLIRSEDSGFSDELFKSLAGEFFINMISLLGRRTAEMHAALASMKGLPDFEPEPYSLLYQRSLYQSLKNLLSSSFRMLEKNSSKLPDQTKIEIKGILAMRDKIDAVLKRIAEKKISAPRIRIHGDYHLGQVLFTGNDFMIIDFEGEPARMIEERRLKRSPLRDAAGMIRSFHYAVYNSLKTHPAVRAGDNEYLIPRANIWFEYVSEKFKSAYLETASGAGFIPEDKNDLEIMLNVFMVEKALYEIAYEINNRPEWLDVAIDGLKQAMKKNV